MHLAFSPSSWSSASPNLTNRYGGIMKNASCRCMYLFIAPVRDLIEMVVYELRSMRQRARMEWRNRVMRSDTTNNLGNYEANTTEGPSKQANLRANRLFENFPICRANCELLWDYQRGRSQSCHLGEPSCKHNPADLCFEIQPECSP